MNEDSFDMESNKPRASNRRESNFVTKLYEACLSFPNILGFNSSGDSFIIHNMKDLENGVLPQYFRHGNYRSFVRQLNLYGFYKCRSTKQIIYQHPNFLRDRPDLLQQITRQSAAKTSKDFDAADGDNWDMAPSAMASMSHQSLLPVPTSSSFSQMTSAPPSRESGGSSGSCFMATIGMPLMSSAPNVVEASTFGEPPGLRSLRRSSGSQSAQGGSSRTSGSQSSQGGSRSLDSHGHHHQGVSVKEEQQEVDPLMEHAPGLSLLASASGSFELLSHSFDFDEDFNVADAPGLQAILSSTSSLLPHPFVAPLPAAASSRASLGSPVMVTASTGTSMSSAPQRLEVLIGGNWRPATVHIWAHEGVVVCLDTGELVHIPLSSFPTVLRPETRHHQHPSIGAPIFIGQIGLPFGIHAPIQSMSSGILQRSQDMGDYSPNEFRGAESHSMRSKKRSVSSVD